MTPAFVTHIISQPLVALAALPGPARHRLEINWLNHTELAQRAMTEIATSPLASDDARMARAQRLDTYRRETSLVHPMGAFGAGELESSIRLDQHVQARQQTVRSPAPVI